MGPRPPADGKGFLGVVADLLIYAIDTDSAHHRRARRWLEDTLSGKLAFIDSWLRQPYVSAVSPGEGHWAVLRNLLGTAGTADFGRFAGVEHVNPLA